MMVFISGPQVALTDRLRRVASDRLTHALAGAPGASHAAVALTVTGRSTRPCYCAVVTVTFADRVLHGRGAAQAPEYALVNACLDLGRQVNPVPPCATPSGCSRASRRSPRPASEPTGS